MRFVPTLFHGVIDYAVGVFLIALSFALGLSGMPGWMVALAGAVAILYSAATDYELGIARIFPVRAHLLLDAVFGVSMLVLASYFASNVAWIFYAIGIVAIILVFVTKTAPARR